jgi:hypothetical protein
MAAAYRTGDCFGPFVCAAAIGAAAFLAACASNSDDVLPIPSGGSGSVVALGDAGSPQGGLGGRDGGADALASHAGGSAGNHTAGANGSGGTVTATANGGAGVSAAGGHLATGGTGGSAPAVTDDPCTACEKAKCSQPMGYTGKISNDSYSNQVVSWEVCFGAGPPAVASATGGLCAMAAYNQSATTSKGPDSGMPKAALCQALLKCVHATNCTQGEENDDEQTCYCGTTDPAALGQCRTDPSYVATGECKNEIAAALEVTQFPNDVGNWNDACLANGAAFNLYETCDANCCEAACGLPPSGYEDATFCNAGSGGGTGAGGSPATGGGSGIGGSSGAAGVGSGAGGAGGHAAAGSGGSAGIPGPVGAAGAGAVGIGGSGGTTAASSIAISNAGFDAGSAGWTASFGATVSRNAADGANSAQSGSLEVSVVAGDVTLSTEVAATQCVSVVARAMYMVGVQTLVPSGSAGEGAIGLWFYDSPDCTGAIAGVYASLPSATAAWQTVMGTTSVPAGAASATVRLALVKPLGSDSAEALFDNVVVTRL